MCAKPIQSWDIQEFKKSVGGKVGELNPSLDSIFRRHEHAEYFYFQLLKLIEELNSFRHKDDTLYLIEYQQKNKFSADIVLNAIIFGFCQSLHSVTDMLSVVIHHSLSFEKNSPKDYINEESVKRELKERAKTDADYKHLKELFDTVSGSANYKDLEYITNLAKHERLLEISLSLDNGNIVFKDNNLGGAMQRLDIKDFFKKCFDESERRCIDIGNALCGLLK